VAAIFAAYTVARYLPHIPYANKLVLTPPEETAEEEAAALAQPAGMLGAIGVAITTLRPAGKARFGDQFIDVVAEGYYVETGQRVQIIEIDGMRVVVKPV
jgi:membrane-bound ClpP family serine protease